MKNKTLKLLSLTLIVSTIFNTSMPAFAYNVDENDNSIEMIEYQNTEDEDFSNTANVFAQLGSEYKVTIPKTVVLSGESKDASYIVKVKGDIAGYESINVIPDNEFLLYAKNKNAQKASISQDKTQWRYNDFSTNGNGSINASGITAGSWKGTFNFNIDLTKVLGDIIALPVDTKEEVSLNFQYGDFKELDKKEGYTYISTNPEIIEIDEDGKIIAKAAGTTTIIVTDKNGNTKEIAVTVNPTDNISFDIDNIENNEIKIEEGASTVLNLKSANTLNLENLKFETSNPEVATIDKEGNIVAVSKGTTTITVYSDNSVPKTFTITVDKPGEISMSMDSKKTETLKLSGARKTLSFDTDKKLAYESSDTDIVTVDENGNVIAKNVGTTFITVKDEDGKIKKIEVIVKPSDNIVASIDGDKDGKIEIEATENKKLSLSSNDTLILKNVSYVSSNPNIVKIDNDGNIEAINEGTASITIKSDNSIDKVITITVGHKKGDIVKENIKDATCTSTGSYDEVVYCTFCGDEISRIKKTIPVSKHTPDKAVKENEVVATTCLEEGHYDEVIYCASCKKELSRKTINTGKGPHKEGKIDYTLTDATTSASAKQLKTVYCTHCNTIISNDTIALSTEFKKADTDVNITEEGLYRLQVYGGQGNTNGGNGAYLASTFKLEKNSIIRFQINAQSYEGGGGYSAVMYKAPDSNTFYPLLVAGGGANGWHESGNIDGCGNIFDPYLAKGTPRDVYGEASTTLNQTASYNAKTMTPTDFGPTTGATFSYTPNNWYTSYTTYGGGSGWTGGKNGRRQHIEGGSPYSGINSLINYSQAGTSHYITQSEANAWGLNNVYAPIAKDNGKQNGANAKVTFIGNKSTSGLGTITRIYE